MIRIYIIYNHRLWNQMEAYQQLRTRGVFYKKKTKQKKNLLDD